MTVNPYEPPRSDELIDASRNNATPHSRWPILLMAASAIIAFVWLNVAVKSGSAYTANERITMAICEFGALVFLIAGLVALAVAFLKRR